MAFTYVISFDIPSDQRDELKLGSTLERSLGYMRALLPSEMGFMTARAMYSLNSEEYIHVIFQSMWEHWEDLIAHRKSYLDEERMLTREFEPHFNLHNLRVHYYTEVP